jgi:hypothetical protein
MSKKKRKEKLPTIMVSTVYTLESSSTKSQISFICHFFIWFLFLLLRFVPMVGFSDTRPQELELTHKPKRPLSFLHSKAWEGTHVENFCLFSFTFETSNSNLTLHFLPSTNIIIGLSIKSNVIPI